MRCLLVFGMLCCLLTACSGVVGFSTAPNLYRSGFNYPAEKLPQILRTVDPEIYYVTDRVAVSDNYGTGRSPSMAFGVARVKFGGVGTWAELLARTRGEISGQPSTLAMSGATELVRFDSTPLAYTRSDGDLRTTPAAQASYDAQTRAFQDEMRAQIKATGNSRLLVFVHGYNNGFDDSVITLADLWHFAGREAVPIAFSWPAGNGVGPLGYFRDRDAATFSVYHTKEFLRILAAIPEVEQIDIVAHSRGTDVVTNALRELIIETRARGQHPKSVLKTGTLIMAAPDLDVDIVRQRLQTERFASAFEQINLYINPNDVALRLSGFLTRSTRLGVVTEEDFRPGELAFLRDQTLVHFIRVENVRGGLGHSYFRDNPAVLSDMALVLRTRAFPGSTLRPLDQDGKGVWVLRGDYPLQDLPYLDDDIVVATRPEQ